MSVEWAKSTCTDESLARLQDIGVLPAAAIGGWRKSRGERYPEPRPGEIVVFEDFFLRGFRNSCHPFLRKLCVRYG